MYNIFVVITASNYNYDNDNDNDHDDSEQEQTASTKYQYVNDSLKVNKPRYYHKKSKSRSTPNIITPIDTNDIAMIDHNLPLTRTYTHTHIQTHSNRHASKYQKHHINTNTESKHSDDHHNHHNHKHNHHLLHSSIPLNEVESLIQRLQNIQFSITEIFQNCLNEKKKFRVKSKSNSGRRRKGTMHTNMSGNSNSNSTNNSKRSQAMTRASSDNHNDNTKDSITWSDETKTNTYHHSDDNGDTGIEIYLYGNGATNPRSHISKTRDRTSKADTPHFQNNYNDYVRDKLIKPSHAKRLSNGHKYAKMLPPELAKAKSVSKAHKSFKKKAKSKSGKKYKNKHKMKNKHRLRDEMLPSHKHGLGIALDVSHTNSPSQPQMRRAKSAADPGYDYVTGYDHHEHKHDILNLKYHQKPAPSKNVHLTLNIPKSVPKPDHKDMRRRSSVRSFGALYSDEFRHDVAENYRSAMSLKDEFKSQFAPSMKLSVVQYYHDNYIGQNGICLFYLIMQFVLNSYFMMIDI